MSVELGVRSGNTSAVLKSLESKGLLRRLKDATDGRAVRIEPTPTAAANLAKLRAEWARLLQPFAPEGDALAVRTRDVCGGSPALDRARGW
ncbi:MarR family transcriptional regulator [Microbacterium sp. HJ5]